MNTLVRCAWLLLIILALQFFTVQAGVKDSKPASTTTIEAQQKKNPVKNHTLEAWLNRLKKKITKAQSKQNKLVAVAAVRGDQASDAPPLYWKGKQSQGAVAAPELKEFDEAVSAAMNGDQASAKSKLESFISTYPKSPLIPDAKETLKMITEESSSQ